VAGLAKLECLHERVEVARRHVLTWEAPMRARRRSSGNRHADDRMFY
jgi:hypothetical protein